MIARRRNWDMRTILYVLIAAMLVLSAVYVIFLPSEPQPNIYAVQDILNNPGKYINETIIVEGTYYADEGGLGPPTFDSSLTPEVILNLDLETNNVSLSDGTEYRVTGVLQEIESPYDNTVLVELVAESKQRV